MEGRFLRGALLGGIVGAALVSNWDTLMKQCPFLEELKERALPDESGRGKTRGAVARHKTRLMARRHRVKKEG